MMQSVPIFEVEEHLIQSSNFSVTQVKFIDEMLTEQLGPHFLGTYDVTVLANPHLLSQFPMADIAKNRGTLTSTSGMRNRLRMVLKRFQDINASLVEFLQLQNA